MENLIAFQTMNFNDTIFSVAVNRPRRSRKGELKNYLMGGMLLQNDNRATKSRTVAKKLKKIIKGE